MLPSSALPAWTQDVLVSPRTRLALRQDCERLTTPDGTSVGTVADGVICFPVSGQDRSIEFYREVGGPKFHERAAVPYAMSALDTHIYHGYLAQQRPGNLDAVIVDVGGGDGRNAVPWLRWGYQRVVVVDAVYAALARFHARLLAEHADWVGRVLLIEADARELPLRDGCAERVQAIEALAYLNEDYSAGLTECIRILADEGRLIVADRDYEAGLLTRLFYGGGVRGMLEQAAGRDIWDGNEARVVRSRSFGADEFAGMLREHGLRIVSQQGVSALSLILGHEHSTGRVGAKDEAYLSEVRTLLGKLGRTGSMRRSHVIVAERA